MDVSRRLRASKPNVARPSLIVPISIVNATTSDAVILEIGDRSSGDEVVYPDDDIQAVMGTDGKWQFARKDGTRYS